jgi:hypothetical protein
MFTANQHYNGTGRDESQGFSNKHHRYPLLLLALIIKITCILYGRCPTCLSPGTPEISQQALIVRIVSQQLVAGFD